MKQFSVTTWIPYWDQAQALESLYSNYQNIDAVGFFWYKLTPGGNVETYTKAVEDTNALQFAKNNNIKTYALIANLPDEAEGYNWDSRRVDLVISSKDARAKHIQDLLDLVNSRGFDGLALDYENLRLDQKDNFATFVEELARALHQDKKSLEIAIHPKSSNNQRQFEGALAQDYTRLAQAADRLHFMFYTENDTSHKPAPSTTISWVESVMQFTQGKVPPSKIMFGIGLNGTRWVAGEGGYEGISSDLTFEYITQQLKYYDVTLEEDIATKSLKATFTDDGVQNIIYLNNAMSVGKLTDLARVYNAAGISLWRLGGEDPTIWNILE